MRDRIQELEGIIQGLTSRDRLRESDWEDEIMNLRRELKEAADRFSILKTSNENCQSELSILKGEMAKKDEVHS